MAQDNTGTLKKQIGAILKGLQAQDANARVKAIDSIKALGGSSRELVGALEQLALNDGSKKVRGAALKALLHPVHRSIKRANTGLPIYDRRKMVNEITRWEEQGLVNNEQAAVLRQRYDFDFSPAKEEKAKAEPQEKRTLLQSLLSETSISTALYLGAFFTIAAGFLFAAVFETLRIPILTLVMLGFGGVAVALKKRLAQASFVLAIVFSFLLYVDAAVVQDTFEFSEGALHGYWLGASILLAMIWGAGTWFYRSRFFSLLAIGALSSAALQFGRLFDTEIHLTLLLMTLMGLGQLAAVSALKQWQSERFALPAFIAVMLQQVFLLFISAAASLGEAFTSTELVSGWWLVVAFTWLAGAAFFAVSNLIYTFDAFPYFAAAALIPVVWYFMGAFSPGANVMMIATWVWGIVLTLAGEAGGLARAREQLKAYSLPLMLAAVPLLLIAGFGGWVEQPALGVGIWLGIMVLYTGLTIRKPRPALWFGALAAALFAYLAVLDLPRFNGINFYPGFIFLWPALVLFSIDLLAAKWLKTENAWYWPPRFLGMLVGALDVLLLLQGGFDDPLRSGAGFLILSLFFGAYAVAAGLPWIGYLATGGLAMGMLYLLEHFNIEWLFPLTILFCAYFLAGFVWSLRASKNEWAKMLKVSGLGLGVFTALVAPVQGGAMAVMSVAIAATLFAAEAYKQRSVWLALPSNLLYLGAYFMVLIELEVSEPQFFSVGAALLGIIMHYLLLRGGSKVGAGIVGAISQLVLLSTTYIQMLNTGRFLFFFILFFQSLVVILYGIVVRARTFLWAPVIFVVLGVVSAVLMTLEGLLSLLVITCMGLLLLSLGIAALLLRERILEATEELGERLGGWQA